MPSHHNHLEGISHTVEVTATTLYEAIALGLVALRGEFLCFHQGLGINCGVVVDVNPEGRARFRGINRCALAKPGEPACQHQR
jgi:hypothetical protein